jgi:2-polyprenyl-6-methoxyphenol hydroxylase-like FAD-dependent oxidoreductase
MNTLFKKVLIIGGGLAGPVLAMFLQKAGMEADIFEARQQPEGYALTLASNGMAILDALGLTEQVTAAGSICDDWSNFNSSGKRLGGGTLAGGGIHSVMMKRAHFGEILLQAAEERGVRIHREKKLASLEQHPDGKVTAHFEDGSNATGDLLIGADGVHSKTRAYVDPNFAGPVYTGLLNSGGYTSKVAIQAPSEGIQFVYGKHCFFGYHVTKDGFIYWFTNWPVKDEPERETIRKISDTERKASLLDFFKDDEQYIRDIIAGADETFPYFLSYALPRQPASWHRGSVALLGDAAHAISPSSGQGASLALEDAMTLAKCLRDIENIEDAFTLYEQIRRARTEKMYTVGKYGDSGKHIHGTARQWFRDLTAPFFMKLFVSEKATSWMYSYRLDWEKPVQQEEPALVK